MAESARGSPTRKAVPTVRGSFPRRPATTSPDTSAALGAMAALRRCAVEGGSYRVSVSLCRTGMWIRSLGADLDPTAAAGLGDWRSRTGETATKFGRLRHLLPVAEMSRTAPHWDLPPAPIGRTPRSGPMDDARIFHVNVNCSDLERSARSTRRRSGSTRQCVLPHPPLSPVRRSGSTSAWWDAWILVGANAFKAARSTCSSRRSQARSVRPRRRSSSADSGAASVSACPISRCGRGPHRWTRGKGLE